MQGVNLFDFQNDAVSFLLDTTSDPDTKQTVIVKSPTGSGKTMMLIDYIDKYLNIINPNTAFIWFCPGKGDLEMQSKDKMDKYLPSKKTSTIHDSLLDGFEGGTTSFINWELVTKTGNKAISDTERKNLFERVAEAHRRGIEFIVIIDEEHQNNTSKADTIIECFAAKKIVRVSATAKQNKLAEWYEIDELDVINSGLITKALYINEEVDNVVSIDNEDEYLLTLADNKRKAIANAYSEIGQGIRPLVIIQFPNSSDKRIERVEKILADMNYTYDNKMVAKWMSGADNKKNIENITENGAYPVFLLMKQAISTGWDCPRAKILVKLRENGDKDFEIQTIGRLRRMPQATHYENDLLDFCYLYTFDENYKETVMQELSHSFETRRLFLKNECKTFSLVKEYRDKDFNGLGERETLNAVYDEFVKLYKLTSPKDNKIKFEALGYKFGEKIFGYARKGKFVLLSSVNNEDIYEQIKTEKEVDTHNDGIALLHCTDDIKSAVGISTAKTKTILERLFRGNIHSPKKLLKLNTKEYYAFIINNVKLIKEVFRKATAEMSHQLSLTMQPKTGTFTIPEQDLFRYDSTETDVIEFLSNAYKGYSSQMVADGIRSMSERLFERYCESNEGIEWVYKNGDTGQQYFSVVYLSGLGKQWLFYPDYIVKKKNGEVWIIETKGGEKAGGQSKNIDDQIANKFYAFKSYAEKHGLKWGFVRDKNERLKINNTEFVESLQDEHWIAIEKML